MTALPLGAVRLDGGTQPRATINRELFGEYAEAIASGATLPPVITFYDGSDYWLADGFHRYHAHQTLGSETIEAIVHQGSRRDAVLHSVGANADHGWRRSNDDKRRAVTALLNDSEWATWSDNEIARRCRVSPPLVARLRPALTINSYSETERTFRRGDGPPQVMKVAALGRPARALPLVAGRVPDHRPRPEMAASAEVGLGIASRACGIDERKLSAIARSGEIEGARKEGGSWAFETDKLKAWMRGPSPAPCLDVSAKAEAYTYDPEANRPMLAAIDTIEALVAGATAADFLKWWSSYIGGGFEAGVIEAARDWINTFAAGYPAAETSRQALLARVTQEA